MIAIDANILIYAHRADSEWNVPASSSVSELAESYKPWAIPWTCLHEFYAIVTHPKIYNPASTVEQALHQVNLWMRAPGLRIIGESSRHWETLSEIIRIGKLSGPRVHDARIAAICLDHGVEELWSADRDFRQMTGLRVRNPLLDPRHSPAKG